MGFSMSTQCCCLTHEHTSVSVDRCECNLIDDQTNKHTCKLCTFDVSSSSRWLLRTHARSQKSDRGLPFFLRESTPNQQQIALLHQQEYHPRRRLPLHPAQIGVVFWLAIRVSQPNQDKILSYSPLDGFGLNRAFSRPSLSESSSEVSSTYGRLLLPGTRDAVAMSGVAGGPSAE
jgi:hypothetical protein